MENETKNSIAFWHTLFSKRLRNWLIFTVFFALIPVVSSWVARFLFGKNDDNSLNYSKEFLFFIVIICAASANNISVAVDEIESNVGLFNWLQAFFFFVALTFGIVFGMFVILETNPNRVFSVEGMNSVYQFSKWTAVVFGILTTISEIIISFHILKPKK